MNVVGSFYELPRAIGAMDIEVVSEQYARTLLFMVQMPEKADDVRGSDLGFGAV